MRKPIVGVTVGTPISLEKIKKEIDPIVASKHTHYIKELFVPFSDNATAYSKDIPAKAAPYAKINKLGGMTRKCTNVFPEDIAYGYWEINGGTGNVYFISMSGILGSREKFAVKPNTTYCVSSKSSWAVWLVDENYRSLGRIPADGWGYPYTTFTTPSTPCYAVFSSWYDGDYQYDIMINEGAEPLPYEPYFEGLRSAEVTEVESMGANLFNKDTFSIPEAVRNLDGYGWGVNADCFNYIDFEKKQSVKACAKYNLGDMQWQATVGQTAYYVVLPELCKGVFISNYNGSLPFYFSADLNALVVDNDGRSFDEAIALFDGVFVVVELATPIITDISDILYDDNLIAVEGGGTMTFKNEFGYDVPSEVITDIEVASGVLSDGKAALQIGETTITEDQLKSLLGLI